MDAFFTLFKGLPVLATCVMAAASYPPIPADLTTPVQQRIAINGPNGESVGCIAYLNLSLSLLTPY
jgi:acid phosphatase type 7